jgi:N-acetylneuraminic acid mutarotase
MEMGLVISTFSGARMLAIFTRHFAWWMKSKPPMTSRFQAALLLVIFLSACASLPNEVYRGYSGPDLPDASLATVELGSSDWANIDSLRVERQQYGSVKLLPGIHRIEWAQTFGVSVLVDARMIVQYQESWTVNLEAGHAYRLKADRTYGKGYTVRFWIEDARTGAVISETTEASSQIAHPTSQVGQSASAPPPRNVEKAPLPVARSDGVAAVAQGKLYFIGGMKEGYTATNLVHEYDPSQNKWTSKASMPTARGAAAAVELNGSIYVIGGASKNFLGFTSVMDVVEKYDPVSNTWSKVASMPTARFYHMAAVVDGRIYVMGGKKDWLRSSDSVEVYDPAKNQWSILIKDGLGSAYYNRSGASAVAIGKNIFIVGGRDWSLNSKAQPSLLVYDTESGNFAPWPLMNQARSGVSACVLGGKIYAIGGGAEKIWASIEVLEASAKTWTSAGSLLIPRTSHSCAVLGDTIYVIGGGTSGDVLIKSLEALTPTASE